MIHARQMAGSSQIRINQSMPTSLQIPHPPLPGLATLWQTVLYRSIYIPDTAESIKWRMSPFIISRRRGKERKTIRGFLYLRGLTTSATTKQRSILLTLSPKHSSSPPRLEENYNAPGRYLQRRVFMYTGDNVKAMEYWQRITTLFSKSTATF